MDGIHSNSQLTKVCSTCKQEKSVDRFSKKKRMNDGLNCQCKDCQSEYFKKFYADRREEQCARSKKYHEDNPLSPEKRIELNAKLREKWKNNRELHSVKRIERYWDESSGIRERNIERCRKWTEENADRIYKNVRLYYKNNAETIKARVRLYEKNNPDKTKELSRVKSNRRRARLAGSGKQYTRHDVNRLYELQRGKCANCRCSIFDGYHVDHRIPVAKGGDNSPGNIELLCKKCNLKKAAKLPHEFAQENGRLI